MNSDYERQPGSAPSYLTEVSNDNENTTDSLQTTDRNEDQPTETENQETPQGDQESPVDPKDVRTTERTLTTSDEELVRIFNEVIFRDINEPKTIVIFGKRGFGKTYDTRLFAESFIRNGRIPFRVHSVLTISGKIPGCPHINDVKGAFYHACIDVRRLNTRSVIVIDEVDRFAKLHKMDPDIEKVINLGRHLMIWAVWNARRPSKIHLDLRTQADIVVAHYMPEKDIKALEDFADEEFLQKVRELRTLIDQGKLPFYSRVVYY